MPVTELNHYLLVAKNLEKTKKFYQDVLGLKIARERPPFGFPGYWLKAGRAKLEQDLTKSVWLLVVVKGRAAEIQFVIRIDIEMRVLARPESQATLRAGAVVEGGVHERGAIRREEIGRVR